MRNSQDVDSSGPVVQKRDVLLVTGLIASWIVVVYFLVHSSKVDNQSVPPHRKTIRVEQSEITPALLERFVPEDEDGPVLSQSAVETILDSMKIFSKRKPDSFGLFATAEPTPPISTSKDGLILESEIGRGMDQEIVAPEESLGQEGELLESELPEPVAPPSAEPPVPVIEPIKS